MVFGWGESHEAHKQVYGNEDHKGPHDLLAGAASFEAFKLFENHQRKEGKPISHKFAKELLAGIVGAEIDKMAHKRRMDDREQDQTRRYAQQNAEQLYDQYYVENQGAHQYDPNQYGPPPPFWR